MYRVGLSIDVISKATGETLDSFTEQEFFDTREEAEQASAKYQTGAKIGTYPDADAVIAVVDVSESEPDDDDEL